MGLVALLVNPAAGRGRAAQVGHAVHRRLAGHGLAVTVVPDATTAVGADVLVVVGGDGSMHRALPSLAGTTTALAIIPAGSGNDLAADLGLPTDPLAAADLVPLGHTRRLDLGLAGGRPFATVLCAGFDSAVAGRADRMRWPPGPRRYDLAVLTELARLRPRLVRVTLDGVSRELPVTLVAVGNTSRYGGGLRICPDARPDDGLLDVTVVGPISRCGLLRVFPALRGERPVDHPAVTRYRTARIRLEADELTAYADGEPVGPLPVDVAIRPGAVRVVTSAALYTPRAEYT